MKKKPIAILILTLCFIVESLFLYGCKFSFVKKDNYFAVVPTDTYYKATLTTHNENSIGNYDKSWKVLRKPVNVLEENCDVIYVEYSLTDNIHENYNTSIILMYIKSTVLKFDGEKWVKNDETSFVTRWSHVYGSYSSAGTFVEEMTGKVNGRDFPVKYKTNTTEDYIEYTFPNDNEVFRISNNIYHLCLYYTFDYNDTHISQNGSIELKNPTDEIPALNTITESLFNDSES